MVWSFTTVRETAIAELDKFCQTDPLLRVIISKDCNITHWFVPGVNSLAQRTKPLGIEDRERLRILGDAETVMMFLLNVAQVRESLETRQEFHYHNSWCQLHRTNPGCIKPGNYSTRSQHDFTVKICDVFDCSIDGQPKIPLMIGE
jgi:hypothetical protein